MTSGALSAQTDTTRPPGVPPVGQNQDSPAVAPIHHTPHKDSTAKDSTVKRKKPPVRPDSSMVAKLDSAAAHPAKIDSPKTLPNTPAITPEKPATPQTVGPPEAVYWMTVLKQNNYFNFLGEPVVLPFQEHRPNSKDSLFYLILGILFYFALVRIFFEKYFHNLMTLFFRVSLRQQQIREQVLQTPLPSLLLNILFVISGGLYAAFMLHFSKYAAHINFWLLYLDCVAGLIVIYLLKFVVLKFCGWVFNISRATDTYIFVVFLVNKMLGIFLLPFLIVITFSGQQIREIFVTISLVMVFVLLMYRVLAAYRPVRNEIKLNPFYFFLYLCAFEIAPLLLIYKVLLSYLEKMY